MSPELVVVSKKNEPIFYSPSRLNGTVGGGMFGFRELHLVPQANENKHHVFVAFQHF